METPPTPQDTETLDAIMGRRLIAIRRAAQLEPAELSSLSGIPACELEDYESGTIPLPLTRIRSLAAALDTHPISLLLRLLFPLSSH